ncbi:DUF4405 domain-containing protein [Chloroflexota bacterium]
MGLNKNVVRIILDVVMVSMLVLMYEKNAISLSFHEIGGLGGCGLFIIHNGLNRKWIVGITKRFFGRALPLRVRIGYVLGVMLLVTMAFIALSGIMISRTVLIGVYGNVAFWRPAHFFASAVALVLVGIHVGLHWSFIRTMFAKMLRVPRAVSRPLGAACLIAVLAFGAYSMVTSDFAGWLAHPLTAEEGLESGGGQGLGQHRGGGGGSVDSGGPLEVVATYGSIAVLIAAATALTESGLKKASKRRRAPQLAAVAV